MKYLVSLVLFSNFLIGNAQITTTSGTVQVFEQFKSKWIEARTIAVWLPDGYSTLQKYAVVYMHDGQMLFDPQQTWNGQSWDVDETAGRLNATDSLKKFIVVAIWNNGAQRHPEYFPQKPFEQLSKIQQDTISERLKKAGRIKVAFRSNSDLYLKFLVKELKPFIDNNFSVKKDKDNTFIAGSSMGGLISMYAMCEYPKVFGGAACLSTHWTGTWSAANNPVPEVLRIYLKSKLSKIKKNKIYFDYGDQTLDSLYPPFQKKVDQLLLENGFTSANWKTQFFPGKGHSEKAWAERLEIPLVFLLGR